MKKRKDKKGNVLQQGESMRKDGRYEYRFTDEFGKRRSVYADTLNELRQKEKLAQEAQSDSSAYLAGECTSIDLIDRYLATKKGVKDSTAEIQRGIRNKLSKDPFLMKKIGTVKTSDVKMWFVNLNNAGTKKRTLSGYKAVLQPAYQIAVEEDVLRKNPFAFKLSSVIKADYGERVALSDEQVETFLNFCRNDRVLKKHVDEYVVLLETGVRISELCGLTKQDVDLKVGEVKVNKQLLKLNRSGTTVFTVNKTKTESGNRIIPLSPAAKAAFANIFEKRRRRGLKVEPTVDGIGGFIFINDRDLPMVSYCIECSLRTFRKRYAKAHPEAPLPEITPHVLRHTFCTRLANKGVDVKALQYLMGHTDVSTTLNVYTHKSYEHAKKQFNEAMCKEG